MRTPVAEMLPPDVATAIKDTMAAMIATPALTILIEYRRAQSTTYSPTTGKQTRVGLGRWTVRAVRQKIDEKAKGKGRVADDIFLIEKGAMPLDPRKGDEIRFGKDVWTVLKWDSDLQEILWQIEARRTST